MVQKKESEVLAILVPDLYHASVSFFHEHIAAILPGNTVVVHISSNGEKANVDVPVLEISRAKDWPATNFSLISKLVRQINEFRRHHFNRAQRSQIEAFFRKHGVTHVLAEFANTGVMIEPIARNMRLPLTSISHGWDINVLGRMPQWRLRYRRYFQSGARLGASGPLLREEMLKIGAPPSVQVVPCALNADKFVKEKRTSEDICQVVMVARLIDWKGPLHSVAAFAHALRARPSLRLEIVGDGPLMHDLREQVAALSISEQVVIHGAISHATTLQLLSQSDIFLQHNLTLPGQSFETQGVSLLEAMGHQVVPIVTNHGSLPEHVLPGRTGWIVDEGDTGAMADRIVYLNDNPMKRQEMGSEARTYVLENFSPDLVYPKMRKLIGISRH